VTGDPLRLRQVLINLVNNAIKFTRQGVVTLELANLGRSGPENEILKFSVIDTGIGIPQDRQEAIFKRFTQVDQSTTRRYGGTGLGTAIAYQLVALMGGELKVDSTPDHGATFSFTITLPLADLLIDGPNDAAAATDGETEGPGSFATPARILLAEDTPVNQLVVRSHLESRGFEVVVADNGRAAVEACRSRKFDLVLMDIQMPEMDGIEATKDNILKAASGGCNGFFVKPVRKDALDEKMAALGFAKKSDPGEPE
jgi:hypothetical protein